MIIRIILVFLLTYDTVDCECHFLVPVTFRQLWNDLTQVDLLSPGLLWFTFLKRHYVKNACVIQYMQDLLSFTKFLLPCGVMSIILLGFEDIERSNLFTRVQNENLPQAKNSFLLTRTWPLHFSIILRFFIPACLFNFLVRFASLNVSKDNIMGTFWAPVPFICKWLHCDWIRLPTKDAIGLMVCNEKVWWNLIKSLWVIQIAKSHQNRFTLSTDVVFLGIIEGDLNNFAIFFMKEN